MLKNTLTLLIVSIAAVSASAMAAENFYGSASIKMIYSQDENIEQNFYKASVSAGWEWEILDISGSCTRWISYRVSDENLEEMEIDINQAGATVNMTFNDYFAMAGGYSFFTGSSSYSAGSMNGELIFNYNKTGIILDSSLKKTEYSFNGDVRYTSINSGIEISYDVTDYTSADISYRHDYTNYKTFGYIYRKNSLRTGIVTAMHEKFFLIAGLTFSEDSDGITGVGVDGGLTYKMLSHLKLGGIYTLTANFSETDTSTSAGKKGNSGSTINSEIVHGGIFFISLSF